MKLKNKELKEYLNMFEEDAVVCIIPVTLEDRKVYKPQEILMMEAEEMDSPSLIVRLGRARNMDAEERFDVPQAEETYYRYILPDGSAIVICEYKQYLKWKEQYTDENPESVYQKGFLLEPGYHHLHDCSTNETALIRKLMEVQKNEDNKNK